MLHLVSNCSLSSNFQAFCTEDFTSSKGGLNFLEKNVRIDPFETEESTPGRWRLNHQPSSGAISGSQSERSSGGRCTTKKNGGWGKIGPLEIVRFLLNSCCGESQDDGTTPQSPQEMLEFLVEATSLQHSLLLQTFLGSHSRAFSQYIASRKKNDCTTCKCCAVVSKILYIPARDMMDPLFYHHQLSIQALPTRAHAQLNPFLRQIKVVMNNLLGSETCCPFISSSVDW